MSGTAAYPKKIGKTWRELALKEILKSNYIDYENALVDIIPKTLFFH